MYGKELIIDIHKCKIDKFSRSMIKEFFIKLCKLINMERADLHFWDYEGEKEEYQKAPLHLKGISAVQFIMTSSIVIHALDDLKVVYLDIFSCKDFDAKVVEEFSAKWFDGGVVNSHVILRK